MRRGPAGAAIVAGLTLGVLGLVRAPDVRADETQDRIERARQEAQDREARAAEYKREAEAILDDLDAIDREVVAARQSQRELKKRQQQVERELDDARAAVEEAERALSQTREDLEARLVALYKSRSGSGLPVLYAARDFQSGLRMFVGLERVLEKDAQLFADYARLRDKSLAEEERARTLLVEFEGNEAEYLKRKQLEREKLIERRNLVDLYLARADRDLRAANELREAAKRLEAELQKGGSRARAQGKGLVKRQVPRPVPGEVRLGFGRQVDSQFRTVTQRMGVEFDAELGEPVRAVGAGRVLYAGWFRGYGQMVIVDHGSGTLSVSGYLDQLAVDPDQSVRQGQIIGNVGETGSLTGPGLYFELRKDGKPIDPQSWFER